jgi:hypothetical protein
MVIAVASLLNKYIFSRLPKEERVVFKGVSQFTFFINMIKYKVSVVRETL